MKPNHWITAAIFFTVCLLSACTDDSGSNSVVIGDDCNDQLKCPNDNQYCNSERKCVNKKANGEICAVALECKSQICTNYQCAESGTQQEPECSDAKPCKDQNKTCSPKGVCVENTTAQDDEKPGNDCWFYKKCEENKPDYEDCIKKNKLCTDPDKQCNHMNRCVDRSTADGAGLGEACSDAAKCMTGLICISEVCREESFALDKKSCTPTVHNDRCVGNIIIECDENSGKIIVQNCKTNYTNYYIGTTAIPYGPNYVCASRKDRPSYVMCVETCDTPDKEKHICGWDLDDTDIDYSDRYVCQKNKDDVMAYYPVDSETCKSTCEYTTGKCD